MPRRRPHYKKAKKRPQKRFHKKRKNTYNKIQSVIVRTPGVAVPDRMFVKLSYMDTDSRFLASAGNAFGYIRYKSNSLFDVNPLLLSSTVPGFTELSTLYEEYRVHAVKITVRFCNQESFPSVVLVWPTDADQATLLSQQYLQEMCGNYLARFKHVSSKGGADRGAISLYVSHAKLIGTRNFNTDTTYSALVTNNPANLMWMNIGCYSMDNSVYTSVSIPFEMKMTLYSEFFNRRQLVT